MVLCTTVVNHAHYGHGLARASYLVQVSELFAAISRVATRAAV